MLGTNLLVKYLEELAPLFKEVVCVSVAGNHGEVRKNGKAYTDFADNFDLVIADNAARVFQANKKSYGHIKFVIPEQDLSVTRCEWNYNDIRSWSSIQNRCWWCLYESS